MKKIYLKRGKEESLQRFHPWVFSGAISHFDQEPEEGEVVAVYTNNQEFIATGHYQIGSIMVRVLSFQQEPINQAFYEKRLATALDVRRSIGVADNPTNNTYRLVHGEGDNLPGLVIDIYGKTAVMQAHSVGMHVDRTIIAEALKQVMGNTIENIFYKSETTLPFKADLGQENGFLLGGSTEDIAIENGLKFHVDWLKGRRQVSLLTNARTADFWSTMLTDARCSICSATQEDSHFTLCEEVHNSSILSILHKKPLI